MRVKIVNISLTISLTFVLRVQMYRLIEAVRLIEIILITHNIQYLRQMWYLIVSIPDPCYHSYLVGNKKTNYELRTLFWRPVAGKKTSPRGVTRLVSD